MSIFTLFCLACFAIGLAHIAWAGYSIWFSRPKASGRVRCIIKREDNIGAWYTPVVEFEWKGEEIVLESLPKCRVRPDFEVGSLLPLYFPSYAPRLATLEPVSIPLVGVSAFVSVLGLIMSLSSF
jgi:hypothetical protein